MKKLKASAKKKKWDKYASRSVSSLKRQRREKIGAKPNQPWQKGLPHYDSGNGNGK